jgi:hypothetical protein
MTAHSLIFSNALYTAMPLFAAVWVSFTLSVVKETIK